MVTEPLTAGCDHVAISHTLVIFTLRPAVSLCSYMIGLEEARGATAKMLKACLHQHAVKCVTCSLERSRRSHPRSQLLVIVVLGSQAASLRQRAPGLAVN